MISSIGGVSASTQIQTAQAPKHPVQHTPEKTQQPRDTVQLSQTARQALSSGDVDHDGDSH
jgi:hypothetical protein